MWAEAVRVARVNLGRALVLQGEAGEAVSCLGAGDLIEVLPVMSGTYLLFWTLGVCLCVLILKRRGARGTAVCSQQIGDTTRFASGIPCLMSAVCLSVSCLFLSAGGRHADA